MYSVQEDQLRASIATDVEEAYELVQVNVQRLQVARLAAEKFDFKFTLKKTEAQFGTATNQDLLDASIDAANARRPWYARKGTPSWRSCSCAMPWDIGDTHHEKA